MVKAYINKEKSSKCVPINDIPRGRLCRSKSGDIFLRGIYTIFCITNFGNSFSGDNNPAPKDYMAYELPSGYKITLEQE